MGQVVYVGPSPDGAFIRYEGETYNAPKNQPIVVPDALEVLLLEQADGDWDPADDGVPLAVPRAPSELRMVAVDQSQGRPGWVVTRDTDASTGYALGDGFERRPRIVRRVGNHVNIEDPTMAADAVDLGVGFVRLEVWGERAGGDPDGMPAADRFALLRSYGFDCLPLVTNYGEPWSSPLWEQMAVAAIPYATMGVIELSDEPYGSWFWGQQAADPAGHAAMTVRCANAVRTASGGKVGILYAVGGTDGSGGLDYFDGATWHSDDFGSGWILDAVAAEPNVLDVATGLTIHPYGIQPGGYGDRLYRGVARRLDALGYPNLPLWFTECGQKAGDSASGSSSPEEQAEAAEIYFRHYLYGSGHPVEGLCWFGQRDYAPIDPSGDNGWGLVDELGVRRPAWKVVHDLTVGLRDSRRPLNHAAQHAPGQPDALVAEEAEGSVVVVDSTSRTGYRASVGIPAAEVPSKPEPPESGMLVYVRRGVLRGLRPNGSEESLSANPATDPRDLAGLYAGFDAYSVADLFDGAAVSSWTDESGNGRHVEQSDTAKMPLKVTMPDGAVAIRSDGVDDVLELPFAKAQALGTASTVVAMGTFGKPGVDEVLADLGGSHVLAGADGNLFIQAPTAYSRVFAGLKDEGTPIVVAGVFGLGQSSRLFRPYDNVDTTGEAGGDGDPGANGELALFAGNGGWSFMKGEIYSAWVFSRALTTAEILGVAGWITDRR